MSKEQGSESAVSGSQFIKEEEMAEEKEAPRKLSRKDFVKGAAAVAGAGALASCAPAATPAPTCPPAAECPPCPTPWIPETWDEEADVVVCGYGTGGMPAAIEAYDAGAEVLIIEKLDWTGGAARRCGGQIFGGPTIVQKALGIADSADAIYDYLVACGQGWADQALLRVLADNCGPNVDWIIQDLGGEEWLPAQFGEGAEGGLLLSHNHYKDFGFEEVMRSHAFNPAGPGWKDGYPGGTGMYKVWDDAVQAREIRTMLETGLVELVATPDREVLGIRASSKGTTLYIKARKAVVLTTGGWINNAKMLRDYNPFQPLYPGGLVDVTTDQYVPVIGRLNVEDPDQSHGEGIVAAQAIGADLTNMSVASNVPYNMPNANDYTGGWNSGGLSINTQAQVIDVFGDPIPRLYAAPFAAGGTYGYYDPAGGVHIATAFCFGRISGQNAAAEQPWG